jgi:hypothetical protein
MFRSIPKALFSSHQLSPSHSAGNSGGPQPVENYLHIHEARAIGISTSFMSYNKATIYERKQIESTVKLSKCLLDTEKLSLSSNEHWRFTFNH